MAKLKTAKDNTDTALKWTHESAASTGKTDTQQESVN